jgi:uncharacterized SAM-binding protein YcdF (DUF218 family)
MVGYGSYRGWVNLGFWLAKADEPKKSDVIICLSDVERIKKTAELYHSGFAPWIIMTAEKDKSGLTRLGVPVDRITLVSGQQSTFEEAKSIAPILHAKGYQSGLVVTDPFHLRRVRWTFYHVFKDQPVQFTFVPSDFLFVRDHWWKDKLSRYYALSEISKLAYYQVVHGFLGIDQNPEWAQSFKEYLEKKFLKKSEGSGPNKNMTSSQNENQEIYFFS